MTFWTFVLAISAVSIVGGIVNTWIKVRHGYPIKEDCGPQSPAKTRQMDAICAENQDLKATVARLEDRLKVLERIATDPSRRLAAEIDELH
jgi:hypothetical protein